MPSPLENRLLSSIPDETQIRLFKHLELVTLSRDDVIHKSGIDLTHIFFPVDTIISLLYDLADGAATEIAMIGNEGLLGVAVFMGGESTPSRAVVIKTGYAYRISAKRIKDEFNRHEELLVLLLRYTQSLTSQMAQTAICNRRHSLSQQLCRFMLLFLDRSCDNKISITHDLIAQLLGVRREGISSNASKLQSLEAIECHRGHIIINNRLLLEEHCCECYQAVRLESERLFSTV
ncbi:Crp/Fnr family transcriptional regulator [Agaribacterium sp. ZY112]|uniref:Crp/Fnr family transcriptional regulator n=1 Tax=Agaribacterium sp. ZY112 TaxID=3233574 RepID=UPI0035248E9E